MNHVIGGDYNRKLDKVTGGHSLLNNDVRVVEIISPPDIHGVYTAKIEIKTPDGRWVEKDSSKSGNTMFPQHWSAEKIMDEIDSAWSNRKQHSNPHKWIGESSSGVSIEGYLNPRKTAFPVYKKAGK